MTNAARIKIAAVSTALFIGGLSAAGVAVRVDHRQQTHAPPTAAAPRPAPSASFESPAPTDTFEELDDD
jgi:hypothetical protein